MRSGGLGTARKGVRVGTIGRCIWTRGDMICGEGCKFGLQVLLNNGVL